MGEQDWIYMMEQMQQIRLFARLHVRRKRKDEPLSSETLDILSRIALAQEAVTPLAISRQTGLTKPMVSKLIEGLNKKGYLEKKKDEKDRRSYFLQITEEGRRVLNQTWQYYLQPVYEIRRRLGEEKFQQMMALISRANEQEEKEAEQDAVL